MQVGPHGRQLLYIAIVNVYLEILEIAHICMYIYIFTVHKNLYIHRWPSAVISGVVFLCRSTMCFIDAEISSW